MNAILCDKSFYIYRTPFLAKNLVVAQKFGGISSSQRIRIVKGRHLCIAIPRTRCTIKNKHCVALSISVILIGGWEYIGGSHKRGGKGIQELLLLMEILREAMFKLSVGKFKMVDSRFEST